MSSLSRPLLSSAGYKSLKHISDNRQYSMVMDLKFSEDSDRGDGFCNNSAASSRVVYVGPAETYQLLGELLPSSSE